MISITSLYWIWNFMNILWLNDIQCLNSCYIFIFFSSCGIEPTHSIPLSVCWTIELRPFSSLAWSSQLLAFPVPIPSSFGSIGGNIKPHVFAKLRAIIDQKAIIGKISKRAFNFFISTKRNQFERIFSLVLVLCLAWLVSFIIFSKVID